MSAEETPEQADETAPAEEVTAETVPAEETVVAVPVADPVTAEPFVPPAAEPFPAVEPPASDDGPSPVAQAATAVTSTADDKPELLVGGALVGGFVFAKILKALGNG